MNFRGASLIFTLFPALFNRGPLPVSAWPDGAPCLQAVLDSMNPQEAVEHQGGLQVRRLTWVVEGIEDFFSF